MDKKALISTCVVLGLVGSEWGLIWSDGPIIVRGLVAIGIIAQLAGLIMGDT